MNKINTLKYTTIGYIVGFFYRMLSSTWKYNLHFHGDLEPVDFKIRDIDKSLVFAHWHGDEFALIALCKKSKFLALSSLSKDGTIMAAALKCVGLDVVRGSSSRKGAAALIAMIRKVKKENYYVCFAMDGPKGPRHQAKQGPYSVSLKAKASLIQIIVKCEKKWNIPNTWNQCYVPKPFTTIDAHFYPVPQPTKENQDEITQFLNSRTE